MQFTNIPTNHTDFEIKECREAKPKGCGQGLWECKWINEGLSKRID
jgi:hypothetical protein